MFNDEPYATAVLGMQARRKGMTWCDECSGYTHAPWCSEYEEPSRQQAPRPEWRSSTEAMNSFVSQKIHRDGGLPMFGIDLPIGTHEDGGVRFHHAKIVVCGDEQLARWIITEHNQHQQCASQLRFLGDRLEAQAKQMAKLAGENERLRAMIKRYVDYYSGGNAARLGNGQARRSLDEFRAALNHAVRGEDQ